MTYQEHYQQCVANGCSPGLADMLASGEPPAISTATRLASRHGTISKQFSGQLGLAKKLAAKCRRAGFELGANDIYNPVIACGELDPRAVVKSHEVKARTKAFAEKTGRGMQDDDGNWVVKPREPSNPPQRKKVRLAEDLIQREYENRLEKNPDVAKLSPMEKRDLRNAIVSQHGQKV